MKEVMARIPVHFVCSRCKKMMDLIAKLYDDVETSEFCYFRDKLNAKWGL